MRLWTATLTSALFRLAISVHCQLPISDCEINSRNTPSEIGNRKSPMLFTCLSRLQLQLHIRIAHALAFIGVGLTQLMHLSADLTELLLINPGNRQRRLILLNASLGCQTFSF